MYKCLITCLLLAAALPAFAQRDGNDSGESARHNLYEYNLYDRNHDRLRGRGIYRTQDRAYPGDEVYPKPDANRNRNHMEDIREWSEG